MNSLRTCTVVMAHGKAQGTFDRHLPYWQRNGSFWFVACPADDMVRTTYPVLGIGRTSHHNAAANQRFRELFHILARMDFDQFWIHEYDSLCVDVEPPTLDPHKLWGNLWRNTEPKRFTGKQFFHQPLFMSREILQRLSLRMERIPDSAEEGFQDRFLGLAVDLAGVPFAGYEKLGFSRNTIEPEHLRDAVAARKAGATLFHGIKSAMVLDAIVRA